MVLRNVDATVAASYALVLWCTIASSVAFGGFVQSQWLILFLVQVSILGMWGLWYVLRVLLRFLNSFNAFVARISDATPYFFGVGQWFLVQQRLYNPYRIFLVQFVDVLQFLSFYSYSYLLIFYDVFIHLFLIRIFSKKKRKRSATLCM